MYRGIFSVVVLLAVFASVLCANNNQSCDSMACLDGETCCQDVTLGATCYNAATYSCPLGSAGHILCGFQEHGPDFACGTVCYDNVDYACCGDIVYNRNATDIPLDSCINPEASSTDSSSSSSSSSSSGSADNVFMCGTSACATGFCCNDARLGAICYNASEFSCPLGSKGYILCGFQEHGADITCGYECYDNATYVCCNETVYNRNLTDIPCLNNNVPTPIHNGTIIITTNETSSSENAGGFGVQCGNLHCDVGQACCPTSQSGPVCYSTSSSTCANGESGNVLCGLFQQVCNQTCYDPQHLYCGTNLTLFYSGSPSQFASANYVFGIVLLVVIGWMF